MSRTGLWVMAVLTAACSRDARDVRARSGSASMSMDSSVGAAPEQAASLVAAKSVAIGPPTATGAPAAGVGQPATIERMIVRSAEMTLQVADVRRASAQVADATSAAKGFLGAARMWRDGDADRASFTIRVPSASLDATIARLRQMAVRVDNESLTGEDVTRQAVDLTARLTNLRATEAELRALLTTVRLRTQKASDVLEVHTELSRIRGEIDQQTAELQSLTQLAALSTITLELRPDVVATPITTDAWQPRGVVRDALRALAGTARVAVNGVIWLVVYAGPILLLAGVVLLALRRLWTRGRSQLRAATPN